ncbi:uncharacterized protein BDZ99DRAFT_175105 [Mytilinidion resinicola]|uniref:Uncharacterized protein n=1 Tax=Mytilinidion resinicola TaxID=574789 RepID=A0A6A6Y3P4_9PEZI|nr:uncharacterized protein BDZ99DRAFT_175105 [Mytilinidion resinicola]KAF2803143.1 hypothetical protein BDZ99DRAFT_175105 [Mytilinidion resinicola]
MLCALGITSKNDSSPPMSTLKHLSTLKRHRFSNAPTIPPFDDGFDKRDSGSDTYVLTRPLEARLWDGSSRGKSRVYAAGGSDADSSDDDLERGQSRRGETLQEALASSRMPNTGDSLADLWQGGYHGKERSYGDRTEEKQVRSCEYVAAFERRVLGRNRYE